MRLEVQRAKKEAQKKMKTKTQKRELQKLESLPLLLGLPMVLETQ